MFNTSHKTTEASNIRNLSALSNKKKAARESIKAAIERVAAEVPRPRREQPYIFLKTVYKEFLGWRDSPKWESIAREIRRDRGTTKASDYFRFLIDKAAQGAVDGQKSKYIRILRYARAQRMTPKQMIAFVKNCGSINKAVGHIRGMKKLGPGTKAKNRKKKRSKASSARSRA